MTDVHLLFDVVVRSHKPHWDYHAEVQAFGVRLQENFSTPLLKTAFINPCYLQAEQQRRQNLGVNSEDTALTLEHNLELSKAGAAFTNGFLTDFCSTAYPSLPDEAVQSIVGHLTSQTLLAHVARNLGVDDLAMSAECPVPDHVICSTFLAVVGALVESSGAERAGIFLRVGGALFSVSE